MLYPKPKKRKGQKRNKWGTLAEYKTVCAEIYEERGKACEKCNIYIYEPKYHNFNHTAGRRENFINKETIELLCFKCHSQYGGIKERNGEWLN